MPKIKWKRLYHRVIHELLTRGGAVGHGTIDIQILKKRVPQKQRFLLELGLEKLIKKEDLHLTGDSVSINLAHVPRLIKYLASYKQDLVRLKDILEEKGYFIENKHKRIFKQLDEYLG